MSLERRKALVRIANEQELVILEDNPYGLLRYEGDPLPTLYSLDGGRYVIYAGTFSKILSAGLRLGWAAAPGADPRAPEPRQAGRRPLLVAADPVLRRRLLRAPRLAQVPQRAARDLPAPARRDAGRAGGVPAARDDLDEAAGRAVHLGQAARLHRHDRPAGAGAARARGVRARPRGVSRRARRLGDAAELLRRRRGRHPRGHPADRQGRRRAGRALRHADRASSPRPKREQENVVPLRRREAS